MTPSEEYLTPRELLERWKRTVSLSTLNNWRVANKGPAFVKIGGRVLYPVKDVVAFEAQGRRSPS